MIRFIWLLTMLVAPISVVRAGDPAAQESTPQLFEFYGLDSLAALADTSVRFTEPGGRFSMILPTCWQPMPQSHIEGYFSGREPGHYDDTSFHECASGGGAIFWGYLRSPGTEHTALLSSDPGAPSPIDRAGIVYVTKHRGRFDFSGCCGPIAEGFARAHREATGGRVPAMQQLNQGGIALVGSYHCFTSQSEFASDMAFTDTSAGQSHRSLVNGTVHIIVPEQETVWTFILLAPAKHYPDCLERFVTMLYSVDFTR